MNVYETIGEVIATLADKTKSVNDNIVDAYAKACEVMSQDTLRDLDAVVKEYTGDEEIRDYYREMSPVELIGAVGSIGVSRDDETAGSDWCVLAAAAIRTYAEMKEDGR